MNEKPFHPHRRESNDMSVESPIETFAEKIRTLQEKYHIHGHGVSTREEAESIETSGLYTAWSTLQDISHVLPENNDQLLRQIQGWDYEARKYIVLIAVPIHADYYASDAANEERNASENRERSGEFAAKYVFETIERPKNLKTPLNTNKRIPSKRIIGYWDDNNKTFHENATFERGGE